MVGVQSLVPMFLGETSCLWASGCERAGRLFLRRPVLRGRERGAHGPSSQVRPGGAFQEEPTGRPVLLHLRRHMGAEGTSRAGKGLR